MTDTASKIPALSVISKKNSALLARDDAEGMLLNGAAARLPAQLPDGNHHRVNCVASTRIGLEFSIACFGPRHQPIRARPGRAPPKREPLPLAAMRRLDLSRHPDLAAVNAYSNIAHATIRPRPAPNFVRTRNREHLVGRWRDDDGLRGDRPDRRDRAHPPAGLVDDGIVVPPGGERTTARRSTRA